MRKRFLMCLMAVVCVTVLLLAIPVGAKETASGTCGEAVTWVLEDGVLTISGEGEMVIDIDDLAPWLDLREQVTEVVIEDGVTSIGYKAFFYCTNMTKITIADSVQDIGEGAFMKCESLTQITIPEGITKIKAFTFDRCTALRSADLPDSLEQIQMDAFWNCTALESIVIPANVTYIDSGFRDCTSLKTIVFLGDAPGSMNAFQGVTATAYYPKGNSTWTKSVRKSFGGDLTWVAYSVLAPEVTASNDAATGKVQLTWDAVDGAVSYKVYRATSKNGTYKLMKTTTGTSYTNVSAVAGTRYYYKVTAVDANGNKATSEIVSRICDLPQPEVTASNVASSGKIKLTWDKVEGAVKYKVYRATSKNGTYKLMKTTTSTSYTNTGAVAGTRYYYKVVAVHENSSANSAAVQISRICDLARPDVSVSLSSSGKPKLTWDKVDGAVEYKIYRATSKNGTYKLIKTTGKTSFTNTSAVSGKTYYYKVVAVAENTNANSAYSKVVYKTAK